MATIEQLLHRRSDLSTFLVHLTRDGGKGDEARSRLLNILNTGQIDARTARGMAAHLDRYLRGTEAEQRVACFSETPLEHTWMMIENIDNRAVNFSSYWLVFTKTTARQMDCNPVWYIDITPGHGWLTNPINTLVKQALDDAADDRTEGVISSTLADQSILRLTPFFEQMGPTNVARKEFWWEREWRHVGDFQFRTRQVVAILAPENDHATLQWDVRSLPKMSPGRRLPPVIDPNWGLERMIGALSGIDDTQLGPFPGS